jgi:putative phosphoribosyl transferase
VNVGRESLPVAVADVILEAEIAVPERARGIVVFAYGDGRRSPYARQVAAGLRGAGLGTVLTDLLTPAEQRRGAWTGEPRLDIGTLAARAGALAERIAVHPPAAGLGTGLLGAGAGAAAALVAAAARPGTVQAVVCRGGRPHLAGSHLGRVRQPTLLIGDDTDRDLDRRTLGELAGEARLEIVPCAAPGEPGTPDQVARLAGDWFLLHLRPVPHHVGPG